MVRDQTVSIGIIHFFKILGILLQKKPIIFIFLENIFQTICVIKDMVGLAAFHNDLKFFYL